MTSKPRRIVDADELIEVINLHLNNGSPTGMLHGEYIIGVINCHATPEPTRASQASRDLIDRKAALDLVVNTSSAAETWQKINSLPAVSVGEQEYPFYVLDKDLQPMKQPKEPSIAQMIDDALGINGGGLNDIYGLADILRRIVKEIEGLK
mgnify:CR=1 FL=1